ncbi:MAG: regulatory protein RecX, partial [Marinobacter sp.]|nr:regulatory protein RecX [Marinobacter sp.]
MAEQEKPDDQDYKARSVALRLLARREHSRLELSLKLRQRQIERAVIDRVLDDYEAEGWLNDDRFADVYARQRMDLGYGPLRILSELQQRGVHTVPECVEQMTDEDWTEQATRLRCKRFGGHSLRDDWNEKV